MLLLLLIVLLLLVAAGSHPAWSYARDWGYYPSGVLLVLVLFLVVAWLLGVRL